MTFGIIIIIMYSEKHYYKLILINTQNNNVKNRPHKNNTICKKMIEMYTQCVEYEENK